MKTLKKIKDSKVVKKLKSEIKDSAKKKLKREIKKKLNSLDENISK